MPSGPKSLSSCYLYAFSFRATRKSPKNLLSGLCYHLLGFMMPPNHHPPSLEPVALALGSVHGPSHVRTTNHHDEEDHLHEEPRPATALTRLLLLRLVLRAGGSAVLAA